MIIVDANLLLYAYDSQSSRHSAAKHWWEAALSNSGSIGLPWQTILAYLRISTHSRITQRPLPMERALADVASWLARPGVSIVEPTSRHWEVFSALAAQSQAIGPLVPDAHLAAMAIERGATLYSCDHDFGRFQGLAWVDPLADAR